MRLDGINTVEAVLNRDQGKDNERYNTLVEMLHNKGNNRDILLLLMNCLSEKVNELEGRIAILESANENRPAKNVPELLTCKQACELLKMCPATLNLHRKKSEIKALRIGKAFMYELEDLLKLGRPKIRR